jgi:hypothetical protein
MSPEGDRLRLCPADFERSDGGLAVKRSVLIYALAWGALFSVLVVLTNVVFPSPNESDDEYTGWYLALYLGLFLLFAIGGAINSERAHLLRSGAIGGAVAALLMVAMVMLTFAVVDNLFLDVVSQQIDKINAFHAQTTYTSMRDFINDGLLRGLVVALPVVAVVGSCLGAFASLLRQRFTPTATAVA